MYLQISSQKITNVFKEMAQETVITNTNPSPLPVQETDSLRQKKKRHHYLNQRVSVECAGTQTQH